jgi:hypothetical protein
MKKIMGVWCAIFAGLLVLLTGCPTDTVVESGEEYVASAVLVNEKAKYNTAVVFEFDESDAGTDVTDQFIQLSPGKGANREVTVSVSGASGGYFNLYNGRLFFSGRMPPSEDAYGEARSELEKAIEAENDAETKASLQALFNEMNGVPNTEVITLSFQKGETTTTLDVLAVIERKGGKKQERNVADVVSSFLIYGYDVINSSYINRNDVKRGAPILDAVKVDAGGLLVKDSTATSSKWSSSSGESVSELLEKINVSISAEYKAVLFSGKVETEFSTSSSSKQIRRYAKGQGFHITREDFLMKNTARALKDYLADDFVADINSESVAYILRTYGTHLIAGCLLGGEAEFNYSYTGTELNDDTKITAALNATFSGFSGSTNGTYETQAKELNDNSAFTSSSRGGDTTAFMTAEQFTSGYSAWVASVRARPDLCGIPSFDRLIPIWDLAAQVNPTKAAAIQAEFENMVVSQGIKLAGFTYQPERSYVTAIDVFMNSGTPASRSGYTHLVKDDMYSSERGAAMNTYKHDGFSGSYGGLEGALKASAEMFQRDRSQPYIAYSSTATNLHDAIAELRVTSSATSLGAGWQVINVDLCLFSGSSLYLHYRKVNQNDTEAIDFIGGFADTNPGSGQILSGYEWVNNTGRINLFQSFYISNGYIYLTVHKSPFKW